MKKTTKSAFAVILSLIMLLCTVATGGTAYADEAPVSGTCGDSLTWSLSTKGVLTIDGDGRMDDYMNRTYVPWYRSYASIKSVVFTGSVTNIGDYAFSSCSSLSSVTLPEGLRVIGKCAFEACGILTGLSIPGSVTTIGSYAFFNDRRLADITLPPEIITVCEGTFEHCSLLESMTIPEGVTSIGKGAFYACEALETVTLPETLIGIGEQAFYKCGKLGNVTFHGSLRSISTYAFTDCTSFTAVNIPAGVRDIGEGAFSGCTGVESITVDSANKTYDSRDNCNAVIETETGTLIAGCKNTVFPAGISAIGDSAFRGCTGLGPVVIPSGVTSIGQYAFMLCGFDTITLPFSLTDVGFDAFGLWGSDSLDVIYNGNENDRNKISVDKGNDALTGAEWQYLGWSRINTAGEITVDYRADVTITATGTDIPENMSLAIYIGGRQVSTGDNREVTYEAGNLIAGLDYTVKVVDGNGNVQQNSEGTDLVQEGGKITVRTGFFAKLIAFFRGLFGRLPAVEVKPY